MSRATGDQFFQRETPNCFLMEGKGTGTEIKHSTSEPQSLRHTKELEPVGHLYAQRAKAGHSIGSLRNTIFKLLSQAGWLVDRLTVQCILFTNLSQTIDYKSSGGKK